MAKLGSYYGLCPLIDHRSLLGISQDVESGIVIVTLGKNIAVKYKLSDQKQLSSWRTKDKFSSPIIYDEEDRKYVAVFNESFVRFWSGDEEFLDKVKKFKFLEQIYTVFACNNRSFIVFKIGAVRHLKPSVENRKELSLEGCLNSKLEYINDVLYSSFNGEVYVGLLVASGSNNYLYWMKLDNLGVPVKIYKVHLTRQSVSLQGAVFHLDKVSVNFLSLWSDGRVYSLELKDPDLESSNIGDLFTVIESISCREYVSMVGLDSNYIALYGCNCNDEGALLIIYNVQFKTVQCRQPFKLFTNGAKLWRIENSLLFAVGQNLAVIPFYLHAEQLAALVGSHKVANEADADVEIVQHVQCVSWTKGSKSERGEVPKILLKEKIEELLAKGMAENAIVEILADELTSSENVDGLEELLRYFDGVPEGCLVKLLKYVLTLDDQVFQDVEEPLVGNFIKRRAEVVDLILTKRFNESLILHHLRSVLDVNEVMSLLQYLSYLFSEDGHDLPSIGVIESESKLIEWSSVLLDANYQKILLTKDDKVNQVLRTLQNHMEEEMTYFDQSTEVLALLNTMKKDKCMRQTMHIASMNYCIEDFPLY